jgi:DNA-binding IclR family transcriptional regulator
MVGRPTSERLDRAQTVLRAADVLRAVGLMREARFADLLRKTGLANATLRRLLVSLIEAQLVVHDADRKLYSLGSEAYVLGQLAQPAFSFHDLARDGLKRLADLSGDTAFLSARDGLSTVCLHREEGQYPIRTHVLNVGDRHPLGMGAAALAVLGALPEDQAAAILVVRFRHLAPIFACPRPNVEISRTMSNDKFLVAFLNLTFVRRDCGIGDTNVKFTPLETNRDVLLDLRPELDMAELADLVIRAREMGFALNPGLIFPGSWAIARALRAPEGQIVGAVTIAAIEDRLTADRQTELAAPLRKEVTRIERLMQRFGRDGVRLDAAE